MLLLTLAAAAAPRIDRVEGAGIDPVLVERVFSVRAEQLDACFKDTPAAATVTLSFSLRFAHHGIPQDVTVTASRRTDEIVDACLIDAVQATTFPDCFKGGPRDIPVRLRLRPSLQ